MRGLVGRGRWGEFLAGIAAVVSLIQLASRIRQVALAPRASAAPAALYAT